MTEIKKKPWVRVEKGLWKNTITGEFLSCDKAIFGLDSVLFVKGGVIIKTLPDSEVDDSAAYSISPRGGC